MKKGYYIFIFAYCFLPIILLAQKYDNVWIWGQPYYNSGYGIGTIRFDTGNPVLSTQNSPIYFGRSNSAISDTNGNLLLYTNGATLINGDNDTIQNGENLYVGNIYNTTQSLIGGVNAPQSSIIIPIGSINKYRLFHESIYDLDYNGTYVDIPKHLFCTTIDMNLNGGKGKVTNLQKILINDTISGGGLTAIKHSNGKDWWMLIAEPNTENYYTLLIKDDTIIGPTIQRIAPKSFKYDYCYASFSPNGKKYIRYEWYSCSYGGPYIYI